jgi:hypothetical protein
MNHWAIPHDVWRAMEEEKDAKDQGQRTKKQQQHLLDFKNVTGLHEFAREAALHAVAKLIATNNQVGHLLTFYSEK